MYLETDFSMWGMVSNMIRLKQLIVTSGGTE